MYDEAIREMTECELRLLHERQTNYTKGKQLMARLDRVLDVIEPINAANTLDSYVNLNADKEEEEGEKTAQRDDKKPRRKQTLRKQKPTKEQERVPKNIVDIMIEVATVVGANGMIHPNAWRLSQRALDDTLALQAKVVSKYGIGLTSLLREQELQ